MDERLQSLRDAFEQDGYDVAEVTRNRSTVRVVIRSSDAKASALRDLVGDVIPDDEMMGLNVTTESLEGYEGLTTVVSFRER